MSGLAMCCLVTHGRCSYMTQTMTGPKDDREKEHCLVPSRWIAAIFMTFRRNRYVPSGGLQLR